MQILMGLRLKRFSQGKDLNRYPLLYYALLISEVYTALCSLRASEPPRGKPNHIIPSSLISILVHRAALKCRFGLKTALVIQQSKTI